MTIEPRPEPAPESPAAEPATSLAEPTADGTPDPSAGSLPGSLPDSTPEPPDAGVPSMDAASAPDTDEVRRRLLSELAEVDPAEAPDIADQLADALGEDLDGKVAG